jgi:endonuclease/exonuclease/phosphatase family metal-dependent hydrolase
MSFDRQEWRKIHALVDSDAARFGLPERREGSLVMGSFNIRKLGAFDKRSEGAWELLRKICERFDLLAIQEVQDQLEGLRHLKESASGGYGIVASDITGAYPGQGAPERLAFLFRWDAIERTEIASDITYDRSAVVGTLYDKRVSFWNAFDDFTEKSAAWEIDRVERQLVGKRPRQKPVVHLPEFVSFIRQPLCASFRIPGDAGARPIEFLAVNAHLLYGRYKDERKREFAALMRWLLDRARSPERMYHPNIILFGDLNLDFQKVDRRRDEIEAMFKRWNREELADPDHAELNMPFLSVHPQREGVFRSNARLDQTYDQIAFLSHDDRMPSPDENRRAGASADAFDYGVFNFVELFCEALYQKPSSELGEDELKRLYRSFEHDVSDHMPLWVRLPKPAGA